MKPASLPLDLIARFSHNGQVFRSFGRLLAARNGSLLAVPVSLATGDFSVVVDGCPVPWHEVFAAVDTPLKPDFEMLQPGDLAAAGSLGKAGLRSCFAFHAPVDAPNSLAWAMCSSVSRSYWPRPSSLRIGCPTTLLAPWW